MELVAGAMAGSSSKTNPYEMHAVTLLDWSGIGSRQVPVVASKVPSALSLRCKGMLGSSTFSFVLHLDARSLYLAARPNLS